MRNKKFWMLLFLIIILSVVGKTIYNSNRLIPCVGECPWKIKEDRLKWIASEWKTYRNEEYGFEFRYPPNNRFNHSQKNEVKMNTLPQASLPLGTVEFSVATPNFEDIFVIDVGPIPISKEKDYDKPYIPERKSLAIQQYDNKEFTLGVDKGILFYRFTPATLSAVAECSTKIYVFHGNYLFSMPPMFGAVFAPQTGVGECTKVLSPGSDDYREVLSSFKFI